MMNRNTKLWISIVCSITAPIMIKHHVSSAYVIITALIGATLAASSMNKDEK